MPHYHGRNLYIHRPLRRPSEIPNNTTRLIPTSNKNIQTSKQQQFEFRSANKRTISLVRTYHHFLFNGLDSHSSMSIPSPPYPALTITLSLLMSILNGQLVTMHMHKKGHRCTCLILGIPRFIPKLELSRTPYKQSFIVMFLLFCRLTSQYPFQKKKV